ncbi:hypothetical protein IV38_GL001478 [Lactobacillus selangorensis]|uniref:histidine kinase n=1 Tax=Lactobacillus selangorensis TaxID=81857 RepID=A0A0R2FU73_9LACO|nr:ATP-binding protein [Lactobacillus selangorensis]KRN28477.1 hypothetical protein IV38_GL001478 [Lactobacillus selangorensis]KRN31977.1 hypothetical protein IV40_GL001264 [Lactobacillus selangorensis]
MLRNKRGLALFLGGIIFLYGMMLFFVNDNLQQEQQKQLRIDLNDYQMLQSEHVGTAAVDKWADRNRVAIVLPQDQTQHGKQLRTFMRQDTHNQKLQTRSHRELWQISLQGARSVALVMPLQFSWQENPSLFWGLTAVYFLSILVLLAWYQQQKAAQREKIVTITESLAHIRHHQRPTPLLVQRFPDLTPLVNEVHRLDHFVRHQTDKLRLRQDSFDNLIAHLPIGVMLIDADGQVILHNHAMETLLDVDIAADKHPYVDDVKTYTLSRMIEHTLREHKNHHHEIQLLQNEEKAVDANVIELDSVKAQQQILVLLYDLTDMRRIEQMQLDFVGNVSHELKTPITAISGFAETLLSGAQDDPETREQFLKIIYDESQHLNQLIQDILALSRTDRNQHGQTQTVHVQAMVNNELGLLQQLIQQRELTVSVKVPEQLTVQIEAAKLEQIIKNLIYNAVFYNRDHGKVTIEAEIKAQQFYFRVQDTGIGIAADEQPRVFERFYRVDKARARNSGGTGLGLAIVQENIKFLGGQIRLQSQLGVGSTFSVELPLD